eukprot:4726104-Prymnesium_polylepis.3
MVILRWSLRTQPPIPRLNKSLGRSKRAQDELLTLHWRPVATQKRFQNAMDLHDRGDAPGSGP